MGNRISGIAENYAKIGEVYRNKGLYEEALDYHNKALAIHEKLKDWSGMVYSSKGFYDEALTFLLNALEIDEELNDRLERCIVIKVCTKKPLTTTKRL